MEAAREVVRRFLDAAIVAGDRLHARHDRGHQPRRAVLGPREPARGRRDRADDDGAPQQHRPVAARRRREGRRDPRRADVGRGRARPRRVPSACSGREPASSRSPTSANALGTVNPVAQIVGGRARRRRARAGRRRAVGGPRADRRARAGRRLLRVLGPQGLRADGHRRPLRAARRCSRRCRPGRAAAT